MTDILSKLPSDISRDIFIFFDIKNIMDLVMHSSPLYTIPLSDKKMEWISNRFKIDQHKISSIQDFYHQLLNFTKWDGRSLFNVSVYSYNRYLYGRQIASPLSSNTNKSIILQVVRDTHFYQPFLMSEVEVQEKKPDKGIKIINLDLVLNWKHIPSNQRLSVIDEAIEIEVDMEDETIFCSGVNCTTTINNKFTFSCRIAKSRPHYPETLGVRYRGWDEYMVLFPSIEIKKEYLFSRLIDQYKNCVLE